VTIDRIVFHLICDRCKTAWIRVPAENAEQARLGAAVAGWTEPSPGLDYCPRELTPSAARAFERAL